MIDPRYGTAKERATLEATVNRILLGFPLAGLTIHGRSVHVRIDPNCRAPAAAGIGGFVIRPDTLQWNDNDRMFTVLHEWLHVYGNHAGRCGGRDPKIWNYACDYRVNADVPKLLTSISIPSNVLQPPHWVGDMTPEEIYNRLIKDPSQIPQSGSGGKTPIGCEDLEMGEMMGSEEFSSQDELKAAFVGELCAAQASLETTGRKISSYGASIANRLAELKRGSIPWGRLLLGDVVASFQGSRMTWSRPNRRFFPDVLMPTYYSKNEKRLLIGIDVSASVGDAVLSVFKSNIASAAQRASATTIVTFDAVKREHYTVKNPREALSKLELKTGFHSYTDVRCVFEVYDQIRPSACVILTDGYVYMPDRPYPKTLWAVPTGGQIPPWGRTYVMDVSW